MTFWVLVSSSQVAQFTLSLSLPLLMKHFSVILPKKLGQKAEPANGSRRSQRPSTEENEWVIYTTGLPDAANQIFFRNQICKFSFIDHFLFAQLHNFCSRIINLTTDTGFNRWLCSCSDLASFVHFWRPWALIWRASVETVICLRPRSKPCYGSWSSHPG